MIFKEASLYRYAALVILFAGIALGLWLAFRYLLPILLPFLLAWLLSLVVRPVVGKLAGNKRAVRRLVAAFLVLALTGLLAFGIVKGCERAAVELGRLVEGLSREDSEISAFFTELSGWMTSLSRHLPFLDRFQTHPNFEEFCDLLDATVRDSAQAAMKSMGEKVPAFLMSMAGQFPAALIFMTSLLLSCYYFSANPQSPGELLERWLPEGFRSTFYTWRVKLKKALTRYVRAYVILGILTFGEMLLGLTILKIPYAFLMAGVISLVDFLPLFGAGTVLVPWALVSFLMGEGGLATGLLILFGIHTLLRQILEPRLVSRELGLSPPVSLLSVYAGWKLLGVAGMLLAPLLAMAIKEWCSGREKLYGQQKNYDDATSP